MHPVGFETTMSAGERLQNYALDRAATGTSLTLKLHNIKHEHYLPFFTDIVSSSEENTFPTHAFA
jgi:hypothetical protein